jgi:hypothetical protein
MVSIDALGGLFEHLQRFIEQAAHLESPNIKGDMVERVAAIGFSNSSPIETWTADHRNFINKRLGESYSSEDLLDFGDEANTIRLFVGLCLGRLLGLYQIGKLTDEEFSILETQIPGLVFLKSGKFSHRN